MQVHPDLFTHYPEQKNINQESFSRFQAFLDEVRLIFMHSSPNKMR
jgi:hypothetical protein